MADPDLLVSRLNLGAVSGFAVKACGSFFFSHGWEQNR